MLKQLLPRGGELQESEEMRTAPGDNPTRPRALQLSLGWALGRGKMGQEINH